MSLNYGTLKTQRLNDTHRADLSGEVADFVRYAEGLISRELRSSEMITRVDLTDADRVTVDEGFYTLPADYLEERQFFIVGTNVGDIALESVSLAELRRVSGSAPVRHYAVISDREVEFRGVPSTANTIELIYYARPTALANDTDDNDILVRHESIYLDGAKAALYEFSQDIELAERHAQRALDAIEQLNQQAGRLTGGARTQGYYCLSSFGAR